LGIPVGEFFGLGAIQPTEVCTVFNTRVGQGWQWLEQNSQAEQI